MNDDLQIFEQRAAELSRRSRTAINVTLPRGRTGNRRRSPKSARQLRQGARAAACEAWSEYYMERYRCSGYTLYKKYSRLYSAAAAAFNREYCFRTSKIIESFVGASAIDTGET